MARTPTRDRVFAALLRLFPSEFRGDFGDELRADFEDQEAAARTASRRAVAGLWLRTIWDFVRRGPREHLDVLVRDARYGLRVLCRPDRSRPRATPEPRTPRASWRCGRSRGSCLFPVSGSRLRLPALQRRFISRSRAPSRLVARHPRGH
jgi:hypothetical protein